MKKHIILESIAETFLLIKQYKLLVLALFILQILFFSVLAFVQLNYHVAIAGNLASISDYFDNLDLNDEAVAEKLSNKGSILGMPDVYKSYDVIVKSLKGLVIATFLIFAVLNGINWAFTDYLINRKNIKEFFTYLWKFVLLTFLHGSIILVLILTFIKVSFADLMTEGNAGFGIAALILGVAVLYFMFISFALAGKTKLRNIFKRAFMIGTKKAGAVILAYLINIAFVDLLFFLLYIVIDVSFWLLLLMTLLFFFSFIPARIFLILAVNRLDKDL